MIWSAIRSAMEREGIRSIKALAISAGIKESTLMHTRRSDPGSFKLFEILQIDKILHFTEYEWEMIRIRK